MNGKRRNAEVFGTRTDHDCSHGFCDQRINLQYYGSTVDKQEITDQAIKNASTRYCGVGVLKDIGDLRVGFANYSPNHGRAMVGSPISAWPAPPQRYQWGPDQAMNDNSWRNINPWGTYCDNSWIYLMANGWRGEGNSIDTMATNLGGSRSTGSLILLL